MRVIEHLPVSSQAVSSQSASTKASADKTTRARRSRRLVITAAGAGTQNSRTQNRTTTHLLIQIQVLYSVFMTRCLFALSRSE